MLNDWTRPRRHRSRRRRLWYLAATSGAIASLVGGLVTPARSLLSTPTPRPAPVVSAAEGAAESEPLTIADWRSAPSATPPAAAADVAAAEKPPRPTSHASPPRPTTPPAPHPTVVAGQEATLSIPSLGLRMPIFRGGQSVIDRGLVTHYVSSEWRPPVAAGSPGTYWLAAHHAPHGSPFGRLPALQVGAEVDIIVANTTYVYTITSRETSGPQPSYSTVYGPKSGTARILLQTCEGTTTRLLVHGVLSATY